MNELDKLIAAAAEGNVERVNAILDADPARINQKDSSGATPAHYAALNGRREMVRLLVQRGADINSADGKHGATPAGWALEYLRELGAYLAIELDDLRYAIQHKDVRWVARFLKRCPALREGSDIRGTPFRKLARESGDVEIARLFGFEDVASPPRV